MRPITRDQSRATTAVHSATVLDVDNSPHLAPLVPGAPTSGQHAKAHPHLNCLTRLRDALRVGRVAMKPWLNVAESAEYCGLSRDTIYTACERKELRHARVGGRRSIRLKPEWIDAWLERHARGAQEQQPAEHGGSMLGA